MGEAISKSKDSLVEKIISKRRILFSFILILILINFALAFWVFHSYQQKEAIYKMQSERLQEFDLISPEIAWLDVESFLSKQNTYSLDYFLLRTNLIQQINSSNEGVYGLYFQDLNTGISIGINEKEKFVPQSLFKVPLMVAVLKKVQDGEIFLNTTIFLSKFDLDNESGVLFQKGAGYPFTLKELLEIMIQKSDNTAMKALSNRFVNDTNYLEVTSIMGLPPPEESIITVSPKEYSNIFRSLYYSNYLRRPFSQVALSIMTESDFDSQLSSGIPEGVKISHKFGSNEKLNYHHDCGIIYLEKKNYLLCIMSKGHTKEEADLMISNISRTVYEFISQN